MKVHLPCEDCGSRDALTIYNNYSSYCFSCRRFRYLNNLEDNLYKKERNLVNNIIDNKGSIENPIGTKDTLYTYEYIPFRGITRGTLEFFNVKTRINKQGKPYSVVFPYSKSANKVRLLDEKKFYSEGDMASSGLFGQNMFSPGSAQSITITEGELDALSVFQMLGKYPVASVRSASSAKSDCQKAREYLDSFQKIYLCFDNDGPGQKAVREVAELFNFNKVYHVRFGGGFKDANDFLVVGKEKEFKNVWFSSKRFLPEGIISSKQEFHEIIDKDVQVQSVPYPFETLQNKTYGIRPGEFILVTALEGIGKTEIIRKLEYNLLKETKTPIGIIHLEEDKQRVLKGLVGYELGLPVHLPDCPISNQEIKDVLDKICFTEDSGDEGTTEGKECSAGDDRLHIYSHFGSDDPDILLNIIRFMVSSCGCKYVFLDHITMVVTGLETEDERRTLDYLSTSLAAMVHDLGFTLFCVSHVNDNGLTRGSRNISKVANLWLHLDRNLEKEDNITYLTIRKNRFTGKTGKAGLLSFDPETFTISELSQELPI